MFRMIGISIVAAMSLAAVIGIVFAAGALRIRLADDGSPPLAPPPPATQPTTAPAPVVEASTDPEPQKDPVPPPPDNSIDLRAEQAMLSPGLLLDKDLSRPSRPFKRRHNQVGPPEDPPPPRQAITGWREDAQAAEWNVTIAKPDYYEIDLVYASVSPTTGIEYVVNVGDQELKGQTDSSRGGRENYRVATIGNLKLPAGPIKIQFHLELTKPHALLMRLREIRLVPAS